MRKLKILWVEDDDKFGPSIHFRIEDDLTKKNITLEEPELLQSGDGVWETVRDLQPDIIMMDHNLEDVIINGANLVVEIRFHNNDTPIIFYSSEMGAKLANLVANENEVYTSTRADVHSELERLILSSFSQD